MLLGAQVMGQSPQLTLLQKPGAFLPLLQCCWDSEQQRLNLDDTEQPCKVKQRSELSSVEGSVKSLVSKVLEYIGGLF